MIKNLNGGYGITVSGGHSSDPYISPGSNGAGMLRWNSNMNCIEVNDGSMWKQLTWSYPTIELNSETRTIIEWAKKKRDEELKREELAQSNPAIKDLVNQIKEKEEQIKMVQTLLNSPGESHAYSEPLRP